MEQNDKNLQGIYGTLKKEGYNPPEYDVFVKDMQDDKNLQSVRNTLVKHGYTPPEFAEFKADMFGASTPTPALAPETEHEPLPLTEQDKLQERYRINQQIQGFNRRTKEVVDQTRRMVERHTPEGRSQAKAAETRARIMGLPTRLSGIAPAPSSQDAQTSESPQTENAPRPIEFIDAPIPHSVTMKDGEPTAQWLLPDGRLTTDITEADQAAYGAKTSRLHRQFVNRMTDNGLDPSKEEDVIEQNLNDALSINEYKIKALYDKRGRDIDNKSDVHPHDGESRWDAFVRSVGSTAVAANQGMHPTPQGRNAGIPKGQQNDDLDLQNLLAEHEMLEEARARLRASSKLNKAEGWLNGVFDFSNNAKNFFHGVKDKLTDADFYGDGLVMLHQADRLISIESKLKNNEPLTDSEMNLVYASMLKGKVDGIADTPHMYTAGQTVTEMFPFMIQMMLNPASGLSKAMVKKFGKSRVKKIIATAAGDVAESAVLANTLQAPSTIGDIKSRYIGNATKGADGKIVFDGNHNWAESIAKGQGAAAIENFTEKLGEHFGGIFKSIDNGIFKPIGKGITKVGRKAGLGKPIDEIGGFISNVKASDWGKAIANIEKRAQWNGSLGEMLEEEAGIVLNSMFVGDNSLSDLADAKTQIDIVLGVGLFGGFVSGIKTAGYPIAMRKAKKELHDSDMVGRGRFLDGWTEIKMAIDNADESLLPDAVVNLIQEHAQSNEQGKAIASYAKAVMKSRGYNLAKASKQGEGMISPEEEAADDSYASGEELYDRLETENPQEQLEAKSEMDAIGMRLQESWQLCEDAFGEQQEYWMAQVQDDPWELLSNPELTDDQKDAVLYYINSKATMEGVLDSASEAADRKRAKVEHSVELRTHKKLNTIIPATTKVGNHPVFIVSGNVALFDDITEPDKCNVDVRNSETSIIVYDPEKNKSEFSSPDQLQHVDAAINPVDELNAAYANIQAEQEAMLGDIIQDESPISADDVESSAEESVTLSENNTDNGDRPQQDNDGRRQTDRGTVVDDTARSMARARDRSDIRMYEEGLSTEPNGNPWDDERNRRETESQRLVEIARGNGQYRSKEELAQLGKKKQKQTGESVVYDNHERDGRVYKIKDPYAKSPMKGNVHPEDVIYEHLVHNKYFPETAYKFEGISDDLGDVRVILSQDYVEGVEQPTKEQIEAALAEKGLLPEGKYTYGNEEISVTDVTGDNALLGADGKVYFIDPIINFKKPVKKILEDNADAHEAEQPQSALSRMPLTESGKPDYEAVESGLAWDALVESAKGNESRAQRVADAMVKQKRAELDAIKKQSAPNPGKGKSLAPDELLEWEEAHDAMVDAADANLAKWIAIARTMQDRTAAAEKQRNEELQRKAAELWERQKEQRRIEEAERIATQAKAEAAAAEAEARQQLAQQERAAYLETKPGKAETAFDAYLQTLRDETANRHISPEQRKREEREDKAQGPSQYAASYANWDAPESLEEWIARRLSTNDKRVKWSGSGNLAGELYGQENIGERREHAWMTSDKNGMSFAKLVHGIWEELIGDNNVAFNNRIYTDQDVRNAVIDALRSNPTSRGLYEQALTMHRNSSSYNPGLRAELEELEMHEDDIRHEWYQENFHMSAEDLEAAEEQLLASLKENNITEDDMRHMSSETIDEYITQNNNGESRNQGSNSILPQQPTDDSSGSKTPVGDRPEASGSESTDHEASPQEVEPTEAQKEAGNYKMEHRRVDGHNISIENPKGSVRRGTGADGKQWETTMQNDYGYIRGTKGVDGDHIDVFLSDSPEDGDVFVIDQVKDDGSFDEHKVMYGFPSEDAARKAYLSNYEDGWQGLGAITHVSKEEFKKWIQSSKRKTKPFADYASVKPTEDSIVGRSLTEQEATDLIAQMEANAEVATEIELTPDNWIALFGEDGTISTPVGNVRMGENQYFKMAQQGRNGKLGMIKPTLQTPDVIIEDFRPASSGESERDSSYVFVKTFTKDNGERYYHFTSVTVQKDGREVVISNQERTKNRISKLLQQGTITWINNDSLHPKAQVGKSVSLNDSNNPTNSDNGDALLGVNSSVAISSDGKDNTLSADKQIDDAVSSLQSKASERFTDYAITPATYTNKKGKTSNVSLLTFKRELWVVEMRAVNDYAREKLSEGRFAKTRGWRDHKSGGWMFRSEEDARKAAELVSDTEAVDDRQPMTTQELREVVEPAKKPVKPKKAPINRVSLEDVMTDLSAKGETNLSEHAEPITPKVTKNEGALGLVSDARMEELKQKLRQKLGSQLNAGVPPEVLAYGLELGVGYIDRGIKKFADFAKVMIDDLGDVVRPYIKAFYNGVRDMPEITTNGYDEQMTPYDEVRKFDIANFDKPFYNAIDHAAMIVESDKVSASADMTARTLKDHRNENRKKDDQQTATDTAALAGEAEAVASQAENLAKTSASEPELNGAADRIDATLEKVNDQLALLGYYEADEVEKDFNEAYGYMRNAEKKAVSNAAELTKQLLKDLGIDLKVTSSTTAKRGKKPTVVSANIAPVGGDVTITIPLAEERELKINIDLEPADREEGEAHNRPYYRDDLYVNGIMYRVENPNTTGYDRYGSNQYLKADVTYAALLKAIQREARDYMPTSSAEMSNTGKKEDIFQEAERIAKETLYGRLRPIGNGYFGEIYDDFKGRAEDAAEFLEMRRGGDILGVFHRDEVGDIDMVWGDVNGGFAHILDKHVGENKSFRTAKEAAQSINDIIASGDIASMTPDKIVIVKDERIVTLRRNIREKGKKIADKTWILTAYDRTSADNASAISEAIQAQAAPGTEISHGKVKKKSVSSQKESKVNPEQPIGNLFEGLFDETPTTDETTTDLRPRTSTSERESRHEPRPHEPLGESQRNETERPDGRGMGGRDRVDTLSDQKRGSSVPRQHESEQGLNPLPASERKNTRNNRAERGTDYAPKGVDSRIRANIRAIELSHTLLESGRHATPEEMAVLRQFSGWGGLGKAFSDEAYSDKIKSLLGDSYQAAQLSRKSAYYTPAYIIDAMWDIVKAMGFKGGLVLEGSAGIGNIIGLMPSELSERSDIHAVEVDPTTGGILSLLYPDAKVDIQGFESTTVPNGSIDLSITNVPFVADLHVKDTTGDKDLSKKFRDIHDFCIAKNVRKLREGGIGIFITSSGTLDTSAKLRTWVVNEGGSDVVGAFRMHNDTFGGTGATSDIIVVRKRVNGRKSPHAIDVSEVSGVRTTQFDTGDTKKVKGEVVPVIKQLSMAYNRYFIEHPENMAGEMCFGFEKGDTFRPTSTALYPVRGMDQSQRLTKWASEFANKDFEAAPIREVYAPVYDEVGNEVKTGSMVIDRQGRLCTNMNGRAVPLMSAEPTGYSRLTEQQRAEIDRDRIAKFSISAKKIKGRTRQQCLKDYNGLKLALADVLKYQSENWDDDGLQPLLDRLNATFDTFVQRYGNLHRNNQLAWLKNDVDYPSILALESFEEGPAKDGSRVKKFGKTDIFSHRVVEKDVAPTPTNVKDGIIASIYMHGRVDVPYIAEALGRSAEDVRKEIVSSGLGFENPATTDIEVSYEYLSGNVREKLRQAQANNVDGRYNANIRALERIIPMNIPAHLIEFTLGSSWIEPKLYEDFIKARTGVNVALTNAGGTWCMKVKDYAINTETNRAQGVYSEVLKSTTFGHQLMEAAITNRTITVSRTYRKSNGESETVTDKDATAACAARIDEIRQDFKDWARQRMQEDTELSQHIEDVYNDRFNNSVARSIPDEFVPDHFGGAAQVVNGKQFKLRPHQAKAVIRGTMQSQLLAHEVGTGKTYTLITTAMEMRRLGTARKPMIVVQNATVGQFVESAKALYPNARILTIEDADRTVAGRKNFYAKIKYNDWDMIVVPQSVFERIPDSEERQIAFIQDKIEEKMRVLEEMAQADVDDINWVVRQAEREIEDAEKELAEITAILEEKRGKRKEKDEKREAQTRHNAKVRAMEMLDREVDDVENFDEMGIDALLVDEAHEYKHLGFSTAMQRGVKGIDPSFSKKAQGVYLKAQAVNERNNGRNVIFATGTPISNTAAEIWTFMRYLMDADTMKDYGIYYFDDFVRNFGNLQQMLEFTTSGKFKENNRFAGYVNLPELVRIWSTVADTVLTREAGGVSDKIPDMEGEKAQDIYLPQTRALRSVMLYVKARLAEYENMTGKEKKANSHIPLVMYGIAKAAAVDARLVVAEAEDDPNSKTNEAVRQTLRSLSDTQAYNGTVAIFADNYQNKNTGFNIYEDIRAKLIDNGIPAEQIVVMKSGMSVKKKLDIFDRVNRGEIRVIMGSTFTLGTGVNIQERLHTLIHLDAPNRPMDYTQRNGRILRQGNLHKEWNIPVRVLRFGVEDSLDVTAYQRLKTKGAIADSVMNGKELISNAMENRTMEEDEDVFGDITAQLSGSEYAMLKNQAEKEVRKFIAKMKQWEAHQTHIHNQLPKLHGDIRNAEKRQSDAENALKIIGNSRPSTITIGMNTFPSIDAMGDFFIDYNKKINARRDEAKIKGSPSVADMTINVGGIDFVIHTEVRRKVDNYGQLSFESEMDMTYSCEILGLKDVPVSGKRLKAALEDIIGNVMSGNDFRERAEYAANAIERMTSEVAQLEAQNGKPFEHAQELVEAQNRLAEYTEKMKAELAEKEAKYADLDASVEIAKDVDYTGEEEEATEEDEILNRTLDEDELPTDGGYSDADISYANDPMSKVFGESVRTKRQQREFAQRERQRMAERVNELASRLHLDNIEAISDTSGMDPILATKKGFYNKRTGKISIILPNHLSAMDVEKTVLHEAVAHYGLRKLFGEQFDTFLNNVYQAANENIRRQIIDLAKTHGWDFHTATEEYLASLAERTDFKESQYEGSWWDKIKHMFMELLEKIGFTGFSKYGVELTDNELRYLLWRSYANLAEPGRYRSIFGEAADITKQAELKVGNYDGHHLPADAEVAEAGEIYAKRERIEKLRRSESALITGNEIEYSSDIKIYKRNALDFGKRLQGEYTNADTGNVIQLQRGRRNGGLNEILQHDIKDNEHIQSIAALPQIIEKSIYIDSKPNHDRAKNPDVDEYQHYVCGLKIGNEDYTVHSIVAVDKNGDRYYDHKLSHIEKGRLLDLIESKQSTKQILAPTPGTKPTIRSERKIKELISLLQVNEAEDTSDYLFRSGRDYVERDPVMVRAIYEKRLQTGMYQFTEAMQDSMQGLVEFYKAVESAGGKRSIEDIPSFENAYIAENALSSRSYAEMEAFIERRMRPLLDVAASLSQNKQGQQELIDYMMAKHGLERNTYMRDKASQEGENTERDFAGLCGLTGEQDWQDAETAAQQMVDDYEAIHDKSDIDALWKRTKEATQAILKKSYISGLLSKDQYEQIRDMYKFYIPLRGFDEKTSNDVYGYLTGKQGAFSSPLKKAYGRSSKADDPLATIAHMAQNAIIQGNRNRMKQQFLTYVQNHPSDLASVNRLWLAYDETADIWRPTFADIDEMMTPDEIDKEIREFEERMEKLAKSNPDKYKRGRDAIGIPYRLVDGNLKEHQIIVKRNGETFVITINGNPRAAQAVNGLTNPDHNLNGLIDWAFKGGQYINRQLSQVYTTRNPDFVISNFVRDLLYANTMVHVKESTSYALAFNKNYAKFNPKQMVKLLNLYSANKLDMSHPEHRLFYEFMQWGGETGYTQLRNLDQEKKLAAKLMKEAQRTKRHPASIAKFVGTEFDTLNRAVENCARFAAFVTSRECGRDIQRSVYDAKEITVNFNKKGAGGKFMHAQGQSLVGKVAGGTSDFGRCLLVFWNAAIQGTTNYCKGFKKHPWKAIPATTSLLLFGFLQALLCDDGDDENENGYYNVPKYIRRSNLMIKAGQSWLSFPLPVEYRAIYGLGELAYSVMSGREEYTDKELTKEIVSQMSQMLPLDFMEGGGGGHAFVPSAVKPIVEAAANTSWTGLPIYKDTPFNKNMPEWTKAYPRTNTQLVDLSKWMNEASGGNDYKGGAIDINPAQLEYLLNGYFGGYANVVNKMVKTGETVLGERELDPSSIILVNRLVKRGDERTAEKKLDSDFHAYLDEYKETHRLMRKYENEKERGSDKYRIILDALMHSRDGARHDVMAEYISDYNWLDRNIKDPDITDAEKEKYDAELWQLKREIVALMKVAHDSTEVKRLQQQFEEMRKAQ